MNKNTAKYILIAAIDVLAQLWEAQLYLSEGYHFVSTLGFPFNVTVFPVVPTTVLWLLDLFNKHFLHKRFSCNFFRWPKTFCYGIHKSTNGTQQFNTARNKFVFISSVLTVLDVGWKMESITKMWSWLNASNTCVNLNKTLPIFKSKEDSNQLVSLLRFKDPTRYWLNTIFALFIGMTKGKMLACIIWFSKHLL